MYLFMITNIYEVHMQGWWNQSGWSRYILQIAHLYVFYSQHFKVCKFSHFTGGHVPRSTCIFYAFLTFYVIITRNDIISTLITILMVTSFRNIRYLK